MKTFKQNGWYVPEGYKIVPEGFSDELAQEIRRVDGGHSLGAGALAEALMPFIFGRLQPPDKPAAQGKESDESLTDEDGKERDASQPSDDQIVYLSTSFALPHRNQKIKFARALLERFGQPAASAEPIGYISSMVIDPDTRKIKPGGALTWSDSPSFHWKIPIYINQQPDAQAIRDAAWEEAALWAEARGSFSLANCFRSWKGGAV